MSLTRRDLKDTYDRWWLGLANATDLVVGWVDNRVYMPAERRHVGEATCPLCAGDGTVPCPVDHKHMRPNTRDAGYAYFHCPVCDNEQGDGSAEDGGTIACGFCGGGDGAMAEGPQIVNGTEVVWKPDPDDDPAGFREYEEMVAVDPFLAEKYGASTGWYPFPPHAPEGVRRWNRERRRWTGKIIDPYDLVDRHNANTRREGAYDPDNRPPPEWDLNGDETAYQDNEYAAVAAGWYQDPEDPDMARYWNGYTWIGEPVDPQHLKP